MDSIIPYINQSDAQSYFDDARLNAEAWYNSTSIQQLKSLKAATIAIDRLSFRGRKASLTQVNEFPRLNCTTIPNDIQIACCELALTLLDGVDPDLEEDALGDITEAYATVRVTSDPTIVKAHIRAGIPSVTAWKHLLPYLNDPNEIHILKG